jgi:hypothetical protein
MHDRVTIEDEMTFDEAIAQLEKRHSYIGYLLANGKLGPKAARIVAEERRALEWALPRLRKQKDGQ